MKGSGKKRKIQESNPVKGSSESQGMQVIKKQKTCIKELSSSSESSSDEEDNVMSVQATIARKTITISKPSRLGNVDKNKTNSKGSDPVQKALNTKRKPQNIKQSSAVDADSSSTSEDSDSEEESTEENQLDKINEGINSSSSESESDDSDADSEDGKSIARDEMVHKQSTGNENKQNQLLNRDGDSDTSSSEESSSEESSEEVEQVISSKVLGKGVSKDFKQGKNIGSSKSESGSEETDLESNSSESDFDNEVGKVLIENEKTQTTVNKATPNQIGKRTVKQMNTNVDDTNSSSDESSEDEDSNEETDDDVPVSGVKSKGIGKEYTRLTPKTDATNNDNKLTGTLGTAKTSQEVSDSDSSDESDQESDSSDESDGEGPTVKRNQDGLKGKRKHATSMEGSEEAGEEDEEIDDEYAALKKELSNIPLEDLVKIKEKLGLKVFSQIMHGGKFNEKKKARVFKRENKNRPMEMSSKRAVPLIKQSAAAKKKTYRDPRFDDLSGEYSEQHFSQNYAFIDDIKTREKEMVSRKLKDVEDETEKNDLQFLLNRMSQQQKEKERKDKKQKLEAAWRQKEKGMVKDGKTPYFLKEADKKKLVLAEKFRELKETGQMDQYLKKKHKKNAQKERRKLPQAGRPTF